MIIILFRKLEAAKFYQNWLFFVYMEVFMKYLRFYIIFGVTFLICTYLIFFDPFAKYLGIFKKDMTIEYDVLEEGYHWECVSNGVLAVNEVSNTKWEFEPEGNGKATLMFYYVNDEDKTDVKYTINYEFDVFFNQIFWSVGEAMGLNNFPNPY